MAAKTANTAPGSQNVKLPVIIVAVVVLVAFLGWWGWKNFGPQPAIKTEAAVAHDKWMDQIARQSGGDISKLSAEDMEKLQKQTYGHGDLALKAYCKDHGIPTR